MWLLFLLSFNSAVNLSHNDFYIREETQQRLAVLSIAAWPSVVTASTADLESSYRCWPLLQKWRELHAKKQAVALLDSDWFLSWEEAGYLYRNPLLWKAVSKEVDSRIKNYETAAVLLDPYSSYWNSSGDCSDLYRFFNACQFNYGKGLSWPFQR